MKYVDVIIDNNSDHTDVFYSYRCPFDEVVRGDLVFVPFGKGNRQKRGFVFRVSDVPPENVGRFKEVTGIFQEYRLNDEMLSLAEFMRGAFMCRYVEALNVMIPPGEAGRRAAGRLPDYEKRDVERDVPPELTGEQKLAVDRILRTVNCMSEKSDNTGESCSPVQPGRKGETILLQGVTGSGKTEVYMRSIAGVLAAGKSAIVLVPEISLTPQTIERFAARFGKENIAVIHSKLTKGQRYDQWMKAYSGQAKIMIGARSAVFAPFSNPGIIIIDEEHESSYKSEMAPKYDAISVARERGRYHGIPVVLGSATPSVVTAFRAEKGEYARVYMNNRYNNVVMPKPHIVDMRRELRMGNRSMISRLLQEKILEHTGEGRQVILFLNRRGYASFISCRNCGYIVKCDSCDISMTYHKTYNKCECHYCGSVKPVPLVCPECGSKYIRHFGTGTEQVEEAVQAMFPGLVVGRMDADTTRLKGSTEKLLKAFRKGEINILVGTQLVAKGLDFANVGLVGIIAADITLNIPDFRSAERTYQLVTQAAGRAGRGSRQGEVVIQTYSPDNYAVVSASKNDYNGFYSSEVRMRHLAGYPPFTEIIRVLVTGDAEADVAVEAREIRRLLDRALAARPAGAGGMELLGPAPAFRSRISNQYRYQMIIKCSDERRGECIALLGEMRRQRSLIRRKGGEIFISVDINPYSIS